MGRRGGTIGGLAACLAACIVAGIAGCVDLSLGQKNSGGAGASGSGSGGAASGDGADAGAVTGVDCITEPTTSAQLCTGISSCPGLYVDHDVFPNCGFRVKGATLDIECACSGDVCPLGVPSTCEQAKALLSSQTEATVCTQVSESRCTAGAPSTGGAGGTSGGGSSTCDKACAGECGGEPSCIQGCGC